MTLNQHHTLVYSLVIEVGGLRNLFGVIPVRGLDHLYFTPGGLKKGQDFLLDNRSRLALATDRVH